MYQQQVNETVNMILRNPDLWSDGLINETLQRFKKSNSARDLSSPDVQQLIRSYLITLSDEMKKKESVNKERKENVLPDVNPFFVSGI